MLRLCCDCLVQLGGLDDLDVDQADDEHRRPGRSRRRMTSVAESAAADRLRHAVRSFPGGLLTRRSRGGPAGHRVEGAWSWFGSDSTDGVADPPVRRAGAARSSQRRPVPRRLRGRARGAVGGPVASAPCRRSAVPVSLLVGRVARLRARGTSSSRVFGIWLSVVAVASSGVAGVGVPTRDRSSGRGTPGSSCATMPSDWALFARFCGESRTRAARRATAASRRQLGLLGLTGE